MLYVNFPFRLLYYRSYMHSFVLSVYVVSFCSLLFPNLCVCNRVLVMSFLSFVCVCMLSLCSPFLRFVVGFFCIPASFFCVVCMFVE